MDPNQRSTNGFWLSLGLTGPNSHSWVDSTGILFEASKSKARGAKNKRDAPCSTNVSELGRGGEKKKLFANVIFAKGLQLKINIFLHFAVKNTLCRELSILANNSDSYGNHHKYYKRLTRSPNFVVPSHSKE